MAEASLKLGGDWATKEGSLLGFNDQNGNYKPIPFDFTRATTATRVNRDGLIEEVQSGVPRIDFLDNPDGALKLEPQRTNLVTHSEDFTNASWTKTGTTSVSANDTISPDGTQNASTISGLTGSGNNDLYFLTGQNPASKTYSFSAYLKGSGSIRMALSNNVDDGGSGVFTLTDDWVRYEIQKTFNATSGNLSATFDDNGGTATSFKIYGAQLEEGSYATSYIKTSGSAVTRNADVCNNAQTTFNDSEGVLYAEIAGNADSTSKVITLGDGTSNNRIQIFYHSSNELRGNIISGGVGQTTGFDYTGDIEVFNKVAIKYKGNDCSFWVNGTEIATDVSATMPSGLDTLMFDNGTGASDFYGNCKEIRVYNTALTDTELQELTTL